MSQVDFKRAFNKMKHDLESWRGLIIATDSVLKWEKNYHPALVVAGVSLPYFVLWILEMSTLTMLSLTGLFFVAFDYAYPSISHFVFNTNNWSGTQETQFDDVCAQLCTIKIKVVSWYEFMFAAKERKSPIFVIFVIVSLGALAWVGAVIDNFLLMYVVTLCVVMYPGIKSQGALDAIKNKFGCIVSSKMQKLREKSKKGD